MWPSIILSKTKEKLEPQNSVEDFIQLMNKITSRSANPEDAINLVSTLELLLLLNVQNAVLIKVQRTIIWVSRKNTAIIE